MNQSGLLQDIINAVAERTWRRSGTRPSVVINEYMLEEALRVLLSSLGEASGALLAQRILRYYKDQNTEGRIRFIKLLQESFQIDAEQAVAAALAYRNSPTVDNLKALQRHVEAPRQEILRRLNYAPGGTAELVNMRRDLLNTLPQVSELAFVDLDFVHLFHSWFNHGFLELKRIDWDTSAAVLERIIQYEAVHQIADWGELRRRIDPGDRRLYAFFHPRLLNEPLIFVEIALAASIPHDINFILSPERIVLHPEQADTAIFYSISNCQEGLRGISFGNFLIKRVVQELQRDLPNLRKFVTLSPMPGFATWLNAKLKANGEEIDTKYRGVLSALGHSDWWKNSQLRDQMAVPLQEVAAEYLTQRKRNGHLIDPVARFHLGNGAKLERINANANFSAAGLHDSYGVMVNYRYDLLEIEKNHESFVNQNKIVMSDGVERLLKSAR